MKNKIIISPSLNFGTRTNFKQSIIISFYYLGGGEYIMSNANQLIIRKYGK